MNTIFVSSTFKDLQLERDIIRDRVSTGLNIKAAQYDERVSFCDLRWGIDTTGLTDEQLSEKILDVCLDEIDRCNPPMIVILGSRYGWIPPEETVCNLAKRKQLELEDLRKSVTALEIEYGSLNGRVDNTLFYFREYYNTSIYEEDEEHQKKLIELKNKIIKLTNGKVKSYSFSTRETEEEINKFSEMLIEDIYAYLKPIWEERSNQTPFEKEKKINEIKLNNFFLESELFEPYVDKCINKIEKYFDGKPKVTHMNNFTFLKENIINIYGDVGIGKSTLLANIISTLKETGEYQIAYMFCGESPKSTRENEIFEYLIQSFGDPAYGLDYNKYDEDVRDYRENYLYTRFHRLSRTNKKKIVILDSITQIKKLKNISYYNLSKIESVFFIISSKVPIFNKESINIKLEYNIGFKEKESILNKLLEKQGKELSPIVKEQIISLEGSSNPLFQKLLLQRLNLMDINDFSQINSQGGKLESISQRQIEIINSVSVKIDKLQQELLKVASNKLNPQFISKVIKYISASEFGLTKEDLKELIGDSWSELDFAYLITYFEGLFVLRADGYVDFSNNLLRDSFDVKKNTSIYKDLFCYFNCSKTEYYNNQNKYYLLRLAVYAKEWEFVVSELDKYSKDFIFNKIFELADGDMDLPIDLLIMAYNTKDSLKVLHIINKLIPVFVKKNEKDKFEMIVENCKEFIYESESKNCMRYGNFIASVMWGYINLGDKSCALKYLDLLLKIKDEIIKNKHTDLKLEKNINGKPILLPSIRRLNSITSENTLIAFINDVIECSQSKSSNKIESNIPNIIDNSITYRPILPNVIDLDKIHNNGLSYKTIK